MHWDTFKEDNYNTMGGDVGSRASEVRAGATSPWPTIKLLCYSNYQRLSFQKFYNKNFLLNLASTFVYWLSTLDAIKHQDFKTTQWHVMPIFIHRCFNESILSHVLTLSWTERFSTGFFTMGWNKKEKISENTGEKNRSTCRAQISAMAIGSLTLELHLCQSVNLHRTNSLRIHSDSNLVMFPHHQISTESHHIPNIWSAQTFANTGSWSGSLPKSNHLLFLPPRTPP